MAFLDGLKALVSWSGARSGVERQAAAEEPTPRRARNENWDIRNPFNQLRIVMSASFTKKRVMGLSEYRVFQAVEDEIAAHAGHRVFAQTSLGEIITSTNYLAHRSINSKRVDILVIAPDGYPVLAVEYQGNGHYRDGAAARDAVKKEALRKAGVQLLEIPGSHSHDDIRSMVRMALGRTQGGDSPSKSAGRASAFVSR